MLGWPSGGVNQCSGCGRPLSVAGGLVSTRPVAIRGRVRIEE
ncbi:MAG: hypothetical protein V3U98_05095 [Acidobacteriota bacterium]